MRIETPDSRVLLLGLFAAFLATSLGSCGGSVVGAPCEDGYSHCPQGCVDLTSDVSNCGSCGAMCGSGQECWKGACLDCSAFPGKTFCAGECVDILADSNNCGLCGNVCDSGVPCIQGSCSPCGGDLQPCDGQCVDLESDENNCGSCGTTCLPDEECRKGVCQPPCEPPKVLCDDDCVDLSSNSMHCGECDKACGDDEPTCVKGRCSSSCPDWMSICEGECVDTYYDPNNCGACGVVCPSSSPVCVAGQCVESCLPPLADCGRRCIDPLSDPDHCGDCYNACERGEVCAAGQCRLDCGSLSNCGGLCVDTQTNPAHCGGCGESCAAGRSCIAGECVLTCDDGLAKCGEECVDLYRDRDHCGMCFRDCEDGDLCAAGQCIPDCGLWTFCGFDVNCVDLSSDTEHCGQCRNACPEEWFCVSGQCELHCPDGYDNCNDRCVNLSESSYHCGQCNNACESGICDTGNCREQAAGHLVAIGHDYTQSHPVLRRILGNAVFIAQSSTVRVLAYTQYADAGQMAKVDAAITNTSTIVGRGWQKTVANDAADVVSKLLENDVLLVYLQNAPSQAALREVGGQWTSVLSSFLSVGGVVVFTDSTAFGAGTYNIFDAAGVFSCSGLVAATGHTAVVSKPGDAVAQGTTTNYLGTSNSATFSTEEDIVVAIDKETGRPFVIHKTFTPQ